MWFPTHVLFDQTLPSDRTVFDTIKRFFASKPRDVRFIEGAVARAIVEAYRAGDFPQVHTSTEAAYRELYRARQIEANTKDIWYKPASRGRQDRLTFFVLVVSLAVKVSAYLAHTCVGVHTIFDSGSKTMAVSLDPKLR